VYLPAPLLPHFRKLKAAVKAKDKKAAIAFIAAMAKEVENLTTSAPR
jgi:hypothetical protein